MSNHFPPSVFYNFAILKDGLSAEDGSPHGAAKSRSHIRTETVALEKGLAGHLVARRQIHQGEIGIAAHRNPPLARQTEAPRGLERGHGGITFEAGAAQQNSERM